MDEDTLIKTKVLGLMADVNIAHHPDDFSAARKAQTFARIAQVAAQFSAEEAQRLLASK